MLSEKCFKSLCYSISYSNFFSTKPNKMVHIRATRQYHDDDNDVDDEADEETDYY